MPPMLPRCKLLLSQAIFSLGWVMPTLFDDIYGAKRAFVIGLGYGAGTGYCPYISNRCWDILRGNYLSAIAITHQPQKNHKFVES
jgi:hypothetical protein